MSSRQYVLTGDLGRILGVIDRFNVALRQVNKDPEARIEILSKDVVGSRGLFRKQVVARVEILVIAGTTRNATLIADGLRSVCGGV